MNRIFGRAAMRSETNRQSRETRQIDRRGFIATVSAAGALLARSALAGTPKSRLSVPANARRPRVVVAQSRKVLNNGRVHETLLREMLEASLCELTGAASLDHAWRRLLRPDDIVGIKFNGSGQRVIGTTRPVAETLVSSLLSSGWEARRIVCIESPGDIERKYRTTHPSPGFASRPTDFGSGSDQLANVLRQITALINVPFIKTHNIAGLTCAMKNLSHGLIKHPARYHRNGCSPYVADIVALPEIRDKIRLCLVDGLRVVYAGGPEPNAETISDDGILICSLDSVATDSVAFAHLNLVRKRNNLPPIANVPENIEYLAAAHSRGVGIALSHGIDIVRIFP